MTPRLLRTPSDVSPTGVGWDYCGLRLLRLGAGEEVTCQFDDAEALVLPLAGACVVSCDGTEIALAGRTSVFSEISDFAYIPRGAKASVRSIAGGRIAVPSAVCDETFTFRHGAATGVGVELRGAGQASREVHDIATANTFATDKLIVVEVLTPAGNWSSYPPHKHDEDRPGVETPLEEIYYFEVSHDGPAYHRVAGESDLLVEVRSGDVVTVPSGWHGPSMAAPGYDMYYLNVMAGPRDGRAWLICDEPEHAWVRESWLQEKIDPRLPMAQLPQGAA